MGLVLLQKKASRIWGGLPPFSFGRLPGNRVSFLRRLRRQNAAVFGWRAARPRVLPAAGVARGLVCGFYGPQSQGIVMPVVVLFSG